MEPAEHATLQGHDGGLVSGPDTGAHQCWYPVALSADLAAGQVLGTDLGYDRIVVYRGEDGKLRAQSAYCRHMGADLSKGGEVIGNTIRCPFHHWAYGDGGRCASIPTGDGNLKRANLADLPVTEQFGLVYVFLGDEPLYDIPTFEEYDENKHVYYACEIKLDDTIKAEPWVFMANVFDVVHLEVVHGMDIVHTKFEEVSPYHRRMLFDAKMGTGARRTSLDIYGVNGGRSKGELDGRPKWYIGGLTPSGRKNTRFFMTFVTEKSDDAEEFMKKAQAQNTMLANEDLQIVNNMRYSDFHLVKSDSGMARFIQAVRTYPRASVKTLEAAANATVREPAAHL